MPNKWDEMRAAYKEAEAQVKASDAIIIDMARMLRGRLRTMGKYNGGQFLAALKRELRDFNSNTQRWNQ
jgi:hypothetical protein